MRQLENCSFSFHHILSITLVYVFWFHGLQKVIRNLHLLDIKIQLVVCQTIFISFTKDYSVSVLYPVFHIASLVSMISNRV